MEDQEVSKIQSDTLNHRDTLKNFSKDVKSELIYQRPCEKIQEVENVEDEENFVELGRNKDIIKP